MDVYCSDCSRHVCHILGSQDREPQIDLDHVSIQAVLCPSCHMRYEEECFQQQAEFEAEEALIWADWYS